MKCNRDCFNCVFEDCIAEDLSYKEYKEISERSEEVRFYSDKYMWNKKHPEVIKKAKKKYREKNLEAEKKKCLDYYYANRERIRERNKTDYMRDYKREWMRRYRERKKQEER